MMYGTLYEIIYTNLLFVNTNTEIMKHISRQFFSQLINNFFYNYVGPAKFKTLL